MERIPEPELMDDEAQARAYAEEDFSEANTLFMEQFDALHWAIGIRGSARWLSVITPSYVCKRYSFMMRLAKSTPLTLLPWASKRGEKIHTPISFGAMSSTPPPTPLFAGSPML